MAFNLGLITKPVPNFHAKTEVEFIAKRCLDQMVSRQAIFLLADGV
jgi:hypothetical protein